MSGPLGYIHQALPTYYNIPLWVFLQAHGIWKHGYLWRNYLATSEDKFKALASVPIVILLDSKILNNWSQFAYSCSHYLRTLESLEELTATHNEIMGYLSGKNRVYLNRTKKKAPLWTRKIMNPQTVENLLYQGDLWFKTAIKILSLVGQLIYTLWELANTALLLIESITEWNTPKNRIEAALGLVANSEKTMNEAILNNKEVIVERIDSLRGVFHNYLGKEVQFELVSSLAKAALDGLEYVSTSESAIVKYSYWGAAYAASTLWGVAKGSANVASTLLLNKPLIDRSFPPCHIQARVLITNDLYHQLAKEKQRLA